MPQTDSPHSIAAVLQQAIAHHQAGRFQEAEQCYRAILQSQPGHADANHNLGILAGQIGQIAAGLPHLKIARDSAPSNQQFLLSYTNALLALGDAGAAIDAILAAQKHGLDSADLQNNLGNAWRQTNHPAEALTAFRRAIGFAPDYAPAHYNLACALHDLGQSEEAIGSYLHALKADPGLMEAENNLGLLLHSLARLDEAEAHFRRALQRRPEYGDAHYNLGNLLQERKEWPAAMACFRRCIESIPDFAPAHLRLGSALFATRQYDEAVQSFHVALQLAPAYAETYNELGNALIALGKPQEAAEVCAKAIELKPEFAEAYNNLGNALQASEKFAAAVTCYEQALCIAPQFAAAHNNLGQALQRLDQFQHAISSYQAALRIDPAFAAAWFNLALVQKYSSAANAEVACGKALAIKPDMPEALIFMSELIAAKGQFSAAESLLRQAIAVDPDSVEAWSAITGLRKMTSADDDWRIQCERLVATALPARKEVFLRYALGKYHDDLKNFESAFTHYQRANALAKSYGKKYDRQREAQEVDLLLQRCNKEWLEANRNQTNFSVRPVFIIGMPRSGTSLAEQIVSSHPATAAAGELEYWQMHVNRLDAQSPQTAAPAPQLRELAHGYLDLLGEFSSQAQRVVDKMPGNFRHLGFIHAAFPHARIIHMRRNPKDTCLSIYFQHFESFHYYANDLEDLAHYYRQYQRLMAHWRATLPQHCMLDISYEQLVNDQENCSRRMLDFIGLPWDPECLDFHRKAGTVATASKWQVRQEINNASVSRWRNYENFLHPLLSLTDF